MTCCLLDSKSFPKLMLTYDKLTLQQDDSVNIHKSTTNLVEMHIKYIFFEIYTILFGPQSY